MAADDSRDLPILKQDRLIVLAGIAALAALAWAGLVNLTTSTPAMRPSS